MANSLNIDTSKFGNNSDKFFLHDPALYLDFHDENDEVGLGYLEAEKTWRQTQEYQVFKTGIPKSEIRRDIIDQEFILEGMLKQFQKETLALTMQRRVDTEDTTWDRVMVGSELPAAIFPSAILIGKTVDNTELRLYIRRLQITAEDLEIILGGDEYSSVPFRATAQKDETPLVTNPLWPYNSTYANQDNIAFWAWPKEDSSSS